MRTSILILAAALLPACAGTYQAGDSSPAAAAVPASGEAVLTRMHDEYQGKWYRTLTFVQAVIRPGRPEESWYEAAAIPGKLRIDIAPIDSGRAFLYVDDSLFVFNGGKRVQAAKDRNPLMTLGFDVYAQDPAVSATHLRERGIDLSKVYESTWQGRPVWVVGAARGDTTSNQFWVDRDRLLFVRLIEQRPGQAGPVRMDIEFNRYERLGGGWIAPEVVFRRNGVEFMREIYRDMRADPQLDPALFSTTEYRPPSWVR